MNTKTRIAAILFLTSLLGSYVSSAHAGPGHSHDHGQTAPAGFSSPSTRAELWQVIQTAHAALWQAVGTEKNVTAAHEAVEKLDAAMAALREKTADLDENARARIEGQARNLARAYAAVHHAAHSNEWDKAAAEMKKAEGGLRLLEAQLAK